ncbi:MAG: hypothetical protein ACR2JD_07920 [Nocardioides sp.]
MRWGLRRGAEPPAPAPEVPLGARAVYAQVLDGDSLWLAVAGTTERIGLRREGTSEVLEPADDAPPDHTVTSLRWHLPIALPGDDGATFEVVTLTGTPVRGDALPDQAPMRTPPSRDGRWQFEVRRREGGAVVVRREVRQRTAEVADTVLTDDGVLVTFSDPGLTDPRLLLVDAAGETVAETPVTRSDDLLGANLRADDVPRATDVHWFLAVADGSGSVPLVRPRNDNLMPGRSTVLPLLWSDAGESRTLVRLQYQREGRIRVNRPPVDAGHDGDDVDDRADA